MYQRFILGASAIGFSRSPEILIVLSQVEPPVPALASWLAPGMVCPCLPAHSCKMEHAPTPLNLLNVRFLIYLLCCAIFFWYLAKWLGYNGWSESKQRLEEQCWMENSVFRTVLSSVYLQGSFRVRGVWTSTSVSLRTLHCTPIGQPDNHRVQFKIKMQSSKGRKKLWTFSGGLYPYLLPWSLFVFV